MYPSPWDRKGEFAPQLLKKNQTRISQDMEEKILSLYAKGMSTGDIEAHIRDIYSLEVSDTTVSRIRDKILPVAVGRGEQECQVLGHYVAVLRTEMTRLTQQLPEYETVRAMYDVGEKTAPQAMAEIGDVRRALRKNCVSVFRQSQGRH